MSLTGVAEETLKICERGRYTAPSGREVTLTTEPDTTVQAVRAPTRGRSRRASQHITVTEETTAAAARRLGGDVALLTSPLRATWVAGF